MSHWRNRRVLVTGATGLVGGHLVERLVGEGADVVALVRDYVPNSLYIGSAWDEYTNVVSGDLRDLELMRRILGEYEVDTVFHLAAQTIVGIANRDPWSSWESNVRGTYTLMEAVRLSPTVRRVVAASTDKVYGQSETLPTPEYAPLNAEFPYEASKACADIICRSYHRTFDVPVILTRCGNLFGEGDLNWNRLVPGTIRSMIQGQRPLVRSDGRLIRDYIYVGDAVDGYMRLAEGGDELLGDAYNITDNRPLSVVGMVTAVQQVCYEAGCRSVIPGDIEILGEPVKEIPEQYLDGTRMKLIGWEPMFGFQEGLRRTFEWYRDLILRGDV